MEYDESRLKEGQIVTDFLYKSSNDRLNHIYRVLGIAYDNDDRDNKESTLVILQKIYNDKKILYVRLDEYFGKLGEVERSLYPEVNEETYFSPI